MYRARSAERGAEALISFRENHGWGGLYVERRGEITMFVIVSLFCVRMGEEYAIIALHEDWQRRQQAKVQGFISGELLRTVKGSREFLAIMHFDNRECAQACMDNPGYQSWYRRVANVCSECWPMLIPIVMYLYFHFSIGVVEEKSSTLPTEYRMGSQGKGLG